MRYATFRLPSSLSPRLGVVRGDRIIDFQSAVAGQWRGDVPATLLALIDLGPEAWRQAHELVHAAGTAAPSHSVGNVQWCAPLPRPRKNVFCLGQNYAAHVEEGARVFNRDPSLPSAPVIFTKAPTTINGPYDDIPLHRGVTAQLDWEVELGVVVGRRGVNIAATDALAHVFGYTVINDVTGRDLQARHKQWFKGKSLDGSCPMGPVVVTADEFGDPRDKRVSLRVNGLPKQDATTSDMIFPVAEIIEWLSQGLTLEPGDIIATGTPEGVGMGRVPQEWLQHGDVVEAEVEGIGVMRNRVRDSDQV
jgi:2-keto-4-pentenoate hydratase/2-oxohepta-3-ene-1,7-dioic acid hydratase in catechol pathway